MLERIRGLMVGVGFTLGLLVLDPASVVAGDNYRVDPIHSSVYFRTEHIGISWIHGRFNDVSGKFSIDKEDPSKSSFELTIKAETIDTNNKGRDSHLRGPDFFNVKQFPLLTFKSTSVKPIEGGYEVQGDFTMHGQTRSITFALKGGKEAEFPKTIKRTGFTTELTLKRSDFGMDKFAGMISDETHVSIGMEGTRK